MAYKQIKKYGYRDSLEKGDPEKVIYGVDFDAEFEAIEEAFGNIFGEDGAVGPDDPAFEDVVFQTRTEDQQVISKFTFSYENPLNGVFAEIDASAQSFNLSSLVQPNDSYAPWEFNLRGTMRAEAPVAMSSATTHMNFASNGMGLDIGDTGLPFPNNFGSPAYVWYSDADNKWTIKPELEVDGDLTVNGETSLNGNLNVDGDIDATGNLNVDQNVTIGGQVEGDLTVNGNIIIDGGSILDPNGTPQGGLWTLEADGSISRDSVVRVNGSNASVYTEFKNGQGIEQRAASGMENGSAYRVFINGIPTLQISNDGDYSAPNGDVNVNAVTADSLKKTGGTANQLLCADGSVVDKATVGSDTDLTGYYTKTESDAKYEPKFTKNNAFNKTFGTAAGTVAQGNHTHAYGDLTGLPALYTGADAVKLTGNQEIAGIKTFASDIRCKANVYAYYGSDERLKDDITPMPVGLIDAINASQWKWKEDGRSSGGVIAQQLQEIGLDDWVRESPDGDLGVDYNALIGVLIAEVQDLKRRLADG